MAMGKPADRAADMAKAPAANRDGRLPDVECQPWYASKSTMVTEMSAPLGAV